MTHGDMPVMRPCEEDDCEKRALVGFGNPVEWVCQEHFEERMARLGDMLRRGVRHA